jgi:formylglycine-generating enzyme required for sulfatase activity
MAVDNGKPNWVFPSNNGKQELGKNFPDVKLYTHQPGLDEGIDVVALPIGSIPCTPQGVCGMSGAVNEWTKTAVGNKRVVKGAAADGSPDTQEGGFRCVINVNNG